VEALGIGATRRVPQSNLRHHLPYCWPVPSVWWNYIPHIRLKNAPGSAEGVYWELTISKIINRLLRLTISSLNGNRWELQSYKWMMMYSLIINKWPNQKKDIILIVISLPMRTSQFNTL
jgi:hypothetical protein